jgi:hypothetical protein
MQNAYQMADYSDAKRSKADAMRSISAAERPSPAASFRQVATAPWDDKDFVAVIERPAGRRSCSEACGLTPALSQNPAGATHKQKRRPTLLHCRCASLLLCSFKIEAI